MLLLSQVFKQKQLAHVDSCLLHGNRPLARFCLHLLEGFHSSTTFIIHYYIVLMFFAYVIKEASLYLGHIIRAVMGHCFFFQKIESNY